MDRDARGRFARGNSRAFAPGHEFGRRFEPGNEHRFQPGNPVGRRFQPGNASAFKPGRSGNPGGRSKDHRAALELAREDPSRAALERLTELMMSCDDPRAVIAAARAILSYESGPRGRTPATEPVVQVIRWLDDRDFDAAGNPLPGVQAVYDPARPPRPNGSEDPRD